ncbi:MAG: hypothetical protein K940chlam3_00958 [Chlamydiae bacterium]|nr:hypothetical protein [Chlamydiota bacterium]
MKFIADSEHLRYFSEHKTIEFDDLISPVRLDEINDEIDQVLSKRTGAKKSLVNSFPPAEIYPYARDLWQDSDIIKKFDCQNRFAELILSLIDSRKFILGFDQLLVPEPESKMDMASYYSSAFPKPGILEELSCVHGIHCSLIICLQGETSEPLGFFPQYPGSVTVVSPEMEFDFGQLEHNHHQRFLLVTYAQPDAMYLYREGDPNTHFCKNLGYVFGDKLFQKGHPYLRL